MVVVVWDVVELAFPEGDAGGAGSEDCLKVNVYAPFGAKSGDNRALRDFHLARVFR